MKGACQDKTLKVILETGAQKTLEDVVKTSLLALYSGADIIKTSTGKVYKGATPEAVYAMCYAIKEYQKKTGYSWWCERLENAFSIFDEIRIDHFRGFAGYCAIPSGDSDARRGQWLQGPGEDFISVIIEKFKDKKIIAEDLGYLTSDARGLLDYSGYPGMKVLQFAFSEGSEHLPHYHTKKAVVYTGTHDNDTLKSWAENSPHEVAFAREYLGYGGDIVKLIIRAALASVCDTAIIPMQDWLGKGSEARINTPSVPTGNWKWRMKQGDLDENLAQKMRRLDRIYGRIRV